MDSQLIALDPHQMSQAQGGLIAWCEGKLAELKSEKIQAHGIIEALRTGKMSDARGRRLVTSINKREAFYGKIKAALEAGYYILPPMPHQTFAIRSARTTPLENRKTSAGWNDDVAAAQNLPVGEGEYHNAVAVREVVDTYDVKDKQGQLITKEVQANTAWKDVEFPFFPVKPEIVEATGKALKLKIFDWLGVAPEYRKASDPMVIGVVKHYKQYAGHVHFFIAWWLDTSTL